MARDAEEKPESLPWKRIAKAWKSNTLLFYMLQNKLGYSLGAFKTPQILNILFALNLKKITKNTWSDASIYLIVIENIILCFLSTQGTSAPKWHFIIQ